MFQRQLALEMAKLQMVITFETFKPLESGEEVWGTRIPKHEIANTTKLIMCMDNSHGDFQ